MTDLDQRIDQTLRERAEGSVDAGLLLAGAVSRGRVRVRHRRAAVGSALGMVAVLGAGVAIGPADLFGSDAVPTGPQRPAGAVVPAAPPLADGVPGASARPDLVGADPNVLHFGFTPGGPRYLSWSVEGGVEMARLDLGGRPVTLELAASVEALPRYAQGLPAGMSVPIRKGVFDGSVSQADTFNGKPVWLRHWQPTPGVYARASVIAQDQQDLAAVAAGLRLDRAYHCGGPLRLTALPTGARVTNCEVSVERLPAGLDVLLTIGRPTVSGLRVGLGYSVAIAEERTKGNRTIAGKPAYRTPQGDTLELLGFPKALLSAEFGLPFQGFTEEDAATVLAGARVAEPLDEPASW